MADGFSMIDGVRARLAPVAGGDAVRHVRNAPPPVTPNPWPTHQEAVLANIDNAFDISDASLGVSGWQVSGAGPTEWGLRSPEYGDAPITVVKHLALWRQLADLGGS